MGSDGETHQGIFDLSYLSSIPNMHVMAPKNKWELSDMMKFALEFEGPIAIRYPRGEAYDGLQEFREPVVCGKSEVLYEEEDICILAVGSMVKTAVSVRKILKDIGYACSLVNVRFVKPIDEQLIQEFSGTHKLLVTMEENVARGGFGESVRSYVDSLPGVRAKVLSVSLPDLYVEHGSVDLLKEELGLTEGCVAKRIVTEWAAMEHGAENGQ